MLYIKKKIRKEHKSDCIIGSLANWRNLFMHLFNSYSMPAMCWLLGISKNKGKYPEDFGTRNTRECFRKEGLLKVCLSYTYIKDHYKLDKKQGIEE